MLSASSARASRSSFRFRGSCIAATRHEEGMQQASATALCLCLGASMPEHGSWFFVYYIDARDAGR